MTTPYPDHAQLRGNYAPIRMECDIDDVIVRGELPGDLDITYYRNGPDPQFPPRRDHHWFAGDGMLHMFQVQDGRIRYRNRWVRTGKWQAERREGRSLVNPFNPMQNDRAARGMVDDGLANTNIVWHGGKLLALEEAHAPFEIDPDTLDSIGTWRFDDRLAGPMTAHPKIDSKTGEMLFFGYMASGIFSKQVSYQTVDASGMLTRRERFKAPFASMMHDFIVTDEHVVFPVFPVTASRTRAIRGKPVFAWEPDKGTHLAVMRRDGSVADIRWFETDPCYVFHPMNAYTDGNRIVAHVMQFDEVPLFPNVDGTPTARPRARLTEWTIDLADNANGVRRRALDDTAGEFPRLDERFAGTTYRHGYYAATANGSTDLTFNTIVRHDFRGGRHARYTLPDGDTTGEPVFIPKSTDAAEGDGYLLSVVHRGRENRSDLAFFDAENLADGPIACAELPHRVPYGFHGNWRYNDES